MTNWNMKMLFKKKLLVSYPTVPKIEHAANENALPLFSCVCTGNHHSAKQC